MTRSISLRNVTHSRRLGNSLTSGAGTSRAGLSDQESHSWLLANPGFATIATLVLGALLGTSLVGCRRTVTEVDGDLPPTDPVPVHVVKAELTTLHPTVSLLGTVVAIPERTAVISPKVGGWIKTVSVVEGTTVHAGDELILLDVRQAKVDLAKAEAAVAEKQATLARLRRGYLPQEIEVAREEALRSKQEADSLRAELRAIAPLRAKKEVPDLQYAKVESSLGAAQAGQAAAEAKLKLLQAGTPPQEIAEAQAQLATTEAELEGAKLSLDLCTISSPITGTVMALVARQGMFVERATTLLTVADLSKVFVEVHIPTTHAANVQVGARVDVSVPAYAGQHFQGTVARVASQTDATTGDIVVFVEIANERILLRPGMACRGQLWLPERPDALAVPVAALADRSGTPVVTVVRDGKASEIEVVVGAPHVPARSDSSGALGG